MKDLRKVSPERMQILQDIESLSMEIDVAIIGYEMLTSSERKYINSQLEQLYTKRSSLQRQLRIFSNLIQVKLVHWGYV